MDTTMFLPRVGAGLALILALGTAQAQNVSSDRNVPPATAQKQAAEIANGDPARWTREDSDAASRLKTLRKETAAALQESLGNCRRLAKAERAACEQQARSTYRQEMAGLRDRLAAEQ